MLRKNKSNKKLEKIIEWTKLKIRIENRGDKEIYFNNREIWWASLGANIGHEQDGKNKNFERPVLVVRKLNQNLFWALPMTSQDKIGDHYYRFVYEDKIFSIILSQLRTISSRRLLRKIRYLPRKDYNEILKRVKDSL